MRFKAILFDMDGLLIDSMIHWVEDDKDFFGSRGIELTPDLIKFFTGKSTKEILVWLKKEYGLLESLEDLTEERIKKTDKIYTHLSDKMPGTDLLIKTIKNSEAKQAIASGSPLNRIEVIVDRFGWRDSFDKLISVEDVAHRGKPEPDVYLHATKVLEVKPEDCVVFEDAENGVLSAKAAGMKCVAVLDERWSFGDFSQADLIVDSLENEKVFNYINL